MIAARHSVSSEDAALAVVNRGGACFDTGFVLGDYMTLEVCFLVPDGAVSNCHVLVGHNGGGNDSRDFRLFAANNAVVLDAGRARCVVGISRNEWHTALGPVDARFVVDGEVVQGESYAADGGYGVTNGTNMLVFGDQTKSQESSIRYITVTRYGTGEILCDLWPDRRGGFVDRVSRRLILPVQGSVDVIDWRKV